MTDDDWIPTCPVCGTTEEEQGWFWCGICDHCSEHCEGPDEACYNYVDEEEA